MKQPKASFVIPAHNAQAYLAQAIYSCQTQSVKDIEIIVVDDGSTDGTKELLVWLEKQDERIKVFTFAENKGRSAARNQGNRMAQSPIILVLDSDDIALKHRARDTLGLFKVKNPDVVYGPFQVINEHDIVLAKQKAGPFNKALSLERLQNFIGHSTLAYRKGVALNVPYDEGEFSSLGLDDWKFQWDCITKGYKLEVSDLFLSKYRIYQLPDGSYGSPTEWHRNCDRVDAIKREYIARITDKLQTAV